MRDDLPPAWVSVSGASGDRLLEIRWITRRPMSGGRGMAHAMDPAMRRLGLVALTAAVVALSSAVAGWFGTQALGTLL